MNSYQSISRGRSYNAVALIVFLLVLASLMIYHVVWDDDKRLSKFPPNHDQSSISNGWSLKAASLSQNHKLDSHKESSEESAPDLVSTTTASVTISNNNIDRLHLYCNEQPHPGAEGSGKFPGHEHFVLQDLLVTIRHGDRSGIHRIPGSEPHVHHEESFLSSLTKGGDSMLLDRNVLKFTPRLASFQLHPQPPTSLTIQRVSLFLSLSFSFCLFLALSFTHLTHIYTYTHTHSLSLSLSLTLTLRRSLCMNSLVFVYDFRAKTSLKRSIQPPLFVAQTSICHKAN
jgi:hypothetical protein